MLCQQTMTGVTKRNTLMDMAINSLTATSADNVRQREREREREMAANTRSQTDTWTAVAGLFHKQKRHKKESNKMKHKTNGITQTVS